jgi:hypothetical protein
LRKAPKVRVGDTVALEWADIVSYGRIDVSPNNLPLAVFVSYGKVCYSDNEKITILHEEEIAPEGRSPTVEPTCFPWGCVRKLTRLRPA